MERGTKAVLLFYCLETVWLCVDSMTMSQSLRSLLNHFSKTRNVEVNPFVKQKARDFIMKTFKDHGLRTWTEEFPSNNAQYPGVNVIGQLSGRYTGTRADKIFLIGAHYDSVKTTPGVDDNGSGTTALLQALQLFTSPDKLNCSQDYTLLFVAFDLEEDQPVCQLQGNCSCSGSSCGSGHFVQNFSTYLNSSGVGFQGALILETILNHNTTPNSQDMPRSLKKVLPSVYNGISANNFSGDFLAVIGRLANDEGLIKGITNAFKADATFKTLAVELPYPLEGRPSNWPNNIRLGMQDFFRSDHYYFWDADPSLPAVFITDTSNFRGHMRQCYHQSCDDINHVTSDMITFLARTTDSIVKVATKMTNEKCQMKKVVDCGQNVTTGEGEITTPYYDTQYPNKLDCAWTISVDADQKNLSVKFTTFDLEESADCTADYVEIRNGKDKAAPLIGRYCGKTLPEPIKSSTQSLYMTFHSDELGAFKGFKAEWSSTPVTPLTTPVTTSAVRGYCQGMWQLIGFFVMTSLAFFL